MWTVSFCCGWLTSEDPLESIMGPNLVGCQALPCAEAASYWVVEPGHEVAGYRTPGGSEASAGSPVGGVWV